MKKNSFFTFCFAFIPGAGQMYLGMMKRGVSLMLAFSVISVAAGFLYLPILTVFLPVLWFFAFFDTFNIKAIPYEQRAAQDAFLFQLDGAFHRDWKALVQRRHTLIGGGCILLGFYLLYTSLLRPFLWKLSDYLPWLYDLLRAVPSLIVAVAIIALGIHLAFGGRENPAPPQAGDDFVEYGGKRDE